MKPEISVIICTYNGGKILHECLSSILNQTEKRIEVLCIDGGSTDGTKDYIKEISKKDRRVKIINNPARLPEGKGKGKWLGFRKSKGKVICFIDQDNVIQSREVFNNAYFILKSDSEVIGVLAGLKNDSSDSRVIRYVSLIGTDSLAAYRSADFLHRIKPGKNISVSGVKYEKFMLSHSPMTITGGNFFFYRSSDLKKIGGYTQDVFVIEKLLSRKDSPIAIINSATKHYAESSLLNLAFKKLKWGKTYFSADTNEKFNYMPRNSRETISFMWNALRAITILPNFYYSYILWKRSRDFVSFIFPFQAFLNFIAYLPGAIKSF